MASSIDFVEFVVEQIAGVGVITHKKMFGEYMVYCNGKPIILICNDTAYVKTLSETTAILDGASQGAPYKGAKPHYILDVDSQEQMKEVALVLERITPLPKKKEAKDKKKS